MIYLKISYDNKLRICLYKLILRETIYINESSQHLKYFISITIRISYELNNILK